MIRAALTSLVLLSACAGIPEIEARVSDEAKRAPYPRLIPLDGVIEQASAGTAEIDEANADLDARAAALRLRAAQIQNVN